MKGRTSPQRHRERREEERALVSAFSASLRFIKLPALVLFVLAALGTTALSQFKVTTELVLVDVTVVDRKGNPVKDLKPENFQVFEDNKPQTIKTFDYMDIQAREAQVKEAAVFPDEVGAGVMPEKEEKIGRAHV